MEEDRKSKILHYAADTRKFEIERFWQRSLFFWGFIGAAFVAYGTLSKNEDGAARLLVSCFGLICSVAWTLQNRGSKYWHEAWEQKVHRAELEVLGEKLFAGSEPILRNDWWSARRFSVSRLAIALSDFTVIIWVFLGFELLNINFEAKPDWYAIIIVSLTLTYALSMFLGTGSGQKVGNTPSSSA